MIYSFTCNGHENITGTHRTTLEFTKDKNLSLNGDCIIGINADFSLESIKNFIRNSKTDKVTIIVEAHNKDYNIVEEINAILNPNFNSDRDIVIRKSDYIDSRTLAYKSDKASIDLLRDLISYLDSGKICVNIKFVI